VTAKVFASINAIRIAVIGSDHEKTGQKGSVTAWQDWLHCVLPHQLGDGRVKLTTQQIGKLGELLVQYKLLQCGIESAHLTTDAGIDLVAYSSGSQAPQTIQVKTNLKAKPGGGKGALALDWWFPQTSPAQLIALVDIAEERVWLFTHAVAASLAQQMSNGNHHLYMYLDPHTKARSTKRCHVHLFDEFLLEQCIDHIFMPAQPVAT
jgi:hypothetical protein